MTATKSTDLQQVSIGHAIVEPQGNTKTVSKRMGTLNAKTIRNKAVRCLYNMMVDEELKPADRLNAIKVALDYSGKLLDENIPKGDAEGMLHVVFDNIPSGYAE